jgi:hypothetical protein
VALVEYEALRSSDRVYIELAIRLSGTDAMGQKFTEETRTLVVSRGGARIITTHRFLPQQSVQIHCLKTGLTSESRVIGPIGKDEDGVHYGVEVLNAGEDFWGIRFPSLSESENAASRMLLECSLCRSQEIVHLDVFELEVLLANDWLMRQCIRCKRRCLWSHPGLVDEVPTANQAHPAPSHTVHERKHPRLKAKVDVCVRHPVLGVEIAVTEDVSRGGFRFRSSVEYQVGMLIEAALPYMPAAANVFVPARIVYREENPKEAKLAYGAAYVPTQAASSLTGMRISTPE